MKLTDFMAAWGGDGFGGVAHHEAHFEDEPACDFVDDVAQAFAEKAMPYRAHYASFGRSCVVCDEPVESATAATCSVECASVLRAAAEPIEVGAVIGSLTALRFLGFAPNGHGATWEFQCRCGAVITRRLCYVRSRERTGRFVGCSECSPLANNMRRGRGSLSTAEILGAAGRNRRAWAQRAGEV